MQLVVDVAGGLGQPVTIPKVAIVPTSASSAETTKPASSCQSAWAIRCISETPDAHRTDLIQPVRPAHSEPMSTRREGKRCKDFKVEFTLATAHRIDYSDVLRRHAVINVQETALGSPRDVGEITFLNGVHPEQTERRGHPRQNQVGRAFAIACQPQPSEKLAAVRTPTTTARLAAGRDRREEERDSQTIWNAPRMHRVPIELWACRATDRSESAASPTLPSAVHPVVAVENGLQSKSQQARADCQPHQSCNRDPETRENFCFEGHRSAQAK